MYCPDYSMSQVTESSALTAKAAGILFREQHCVGQTVMNKIKHNNQNSLQTVHAHRPCVCCCLENNKGEHRDVISTCAPSW